MQLPRTLMGNTTAMLQATHNGAKANFTDLAIGPAGSWKVFFSAPGLSDTVSAPLEIYPGLPTSLRILVQPGGAYGGSTLSRQPVVTVLDSGNNVANTTGGEFNVIPYLHLLQQGHGSGKSNPDTKLYLRNGSAAVVQDGFAIFSLLSVDVVGYGYYFRFVMENTDGSNLTVTSDTFDVLPGAAVAFRITVEPADNCWPGVPLLHQPEVLAVDSGGNAANSSILLKVGKWG
jgi:hypothetical protein